VKHLMLEIFK